jgi:hypothetical protein
LSKLRSTVYAHMEETSFRSGAVFGAGALAVTGTAIALAVILTGNSAAAISAPGPSAPARSAVGYPVGHADVAYRLARLWAGLPGHPRDGRPDGSVGVVRSRPSAASVWGEVPGL